MIGLGFVFGYMLLNVVIIVVDGRIRFGSFREWWTADASHPVYKRK